MSARPKYLALAVIVVTGAIAYSNGFNAEFVGLDAKESIRDNPHIRVLWPLSESMSLDLLDETLALDEGAKGGTLVRRPFLSFSFALNYQLSGLDARGYYAVNVLIHIAAALLLFGVLRRTLLRFPDSFTETRASGLAGVIGVLWVAHPLQTEAVTNIVQRAESTMGLCLLLTLYCAIRAFPASRPNRWYAAAIAACAVGMGTKESMIVAPLIVLLYDYTFVSKDIAGIRRHAALHLGLFATWIVLVALILFTAHDAAKDFQEGKTLPYLLAQPAVILEYLRLSLWPHPLHMYVNTDVWAVVPGVTPASRVLMPGAVVVTLLALTAAGLWRRRWWGFAGAWFFVILSPTTSFVATSDVIQEHRMYLSLAAVLLLAVLAADTGLRRLLAAPTATVLGLAVATTVLGLFVWRVQVRNLDYRTEFAVIHPADMRRAHIILAQHELARSNVDEAMAQFEAAQKYITSATLLSESYYDLGNLLLRDGHRELAKQQYERSIEANPHFGDAHNNLAAILALEGDYRAASEHFETALRSSPRFPTANNNLGLIELKQLHLDAAERQFNEALAIVPMVEAYRKNLVAAQAARNDPCAADFDLAFDVPAGYGDVAIRLRRVQKGALICNPEKP